MWTSKFHGPLRFQSCRHPGDSKNELGYRPKDCEELRYKYDVTAAASGTFTADAENTPSTGGHIWPGCATGDLWRGNQKGKIWQPTDAKNVIKQCGL